MQTNFTEIKAYIRIVLNAIKPHIFFFGFLIAVILDAPVSAAFWFCLAIYFKISDIHEALLKADTGLTVNMRVVHLPTCEEKGGV